MTAAASVVIVHHEHAPRKSEQGYLLSILARGWERDGIEVRHLYGTANFVPADVGILHVDLSVVPPEYADFTRRYPVALNTTVLDIRKRRFSTLTLDGPGAYLGPAIVKTDLNAGGAPERTIRYRMDPPAVAVTRFALARLRRHLGFRPHHRIVSASTYELYPSTAEVPVECFRTPSLIVEKFVPERRGAHYCHRRYFFLGEAEVNQVWLGTRPICAGDDDGVAEDAPVPPELRQFRRSFGIEYGKIDYVQGQSGEIVVLDVNKTPWGACRDPDDVPWLDRLCLALHGGIDALVGVKGSGVGWRRGRRQTPEIPGRRAC